MGRSVNARNNDPSSPVMYRVALLGPKIAYRQVGTNTTLYSIRNRCLYMNHGQHYLAVLCYRGTVLYLMQDTSSPQFVNAQGVFRIPELFRIECRK